MLCDTIIAGWIDLEEVSLSHPSYISEINCHVDSFVLFLMMDLYFRYSKNYERKMSILEF